MNQRKICALLAAAMLLSILPVKATATDVDPGEAQIEEVMPAAETEPTKKPSTKPTTKPTKAPTEKPTAKPTEKPTVEPTEEPTEKPTKKPTEKPTEAPTEEPTEKPTEKPTKEPTEKPTKAPTEAPTEEPTEEPTVAPTEEPDDGRMKVSDEFIEVLKQMEGFHPVAYWDYSQWTIGYGTKCPAGKEKYYTKDNPLTKKEALKLLNKELDKFEELVNSFAQEHSLELKQHQFDALVSFTYNCGGGWMRDLNGYFNTAVREGDMSNRFLYGIMLWSAAGGDYILTSRRKCEANMYINGVYKAYNTADSVPKDFKHVFLDGNGGTLRYTIHGYNAADPDKIISSFTQKPTGVDKDGNTFTYTFAGWYTAPEGGKRIKKLDGKLANGTVLYAHWKDPEGNVVTLPKGELVENVEVSVIGKVNVRTGPGTFYSIEEELQPGAELVITETFKVGSTLWGKCEFGWLSLHYTNYFDIISGNTPEDVDGQWGVVVTESGDQVNVRTGPSTSYGVAYTVKTGDRLQIFALKSDGTMQWGQLEDGNWISMNFLELDVLTQLESVEILAPPEKLEYVQRQDELDLTGSVLKLNFDDGTTKNISITSSMVSGFNNKKLGEVTISVAYEGLTTAFTVTIVKATVVFKNYDGTVLSSTQYEYGRTVKAPKNPTKPADKKYTYKFTGWDKKIIRCRGDRVYTAVFEAVPIPQKVLGIVVTETGGSVNVRTGPGTKYDVAYAVEHGKKIEILDTKTGGKLTWGKLSDGNWICMDYVKTKADKGDMNGDYVLNEDDAIYLLRHVIFPDKYPLKGNADANGDKKVNEDDAIYLLRHVIFPDKYPLKLK